MEEVDTTEALAIFIVTILFVGLSIYWPMQIIVLLLLGINNSIQKFRKEMK